MNIEEILKKLTTTDDYNVDYFLGNRNLIIRDLRNRWEQSVSSFGLTENNYIIKAGDSPKNINNLIRYIDIQCSRGELVETLKVEDPSCISLSSKKLEEEVYKTIISKVPIKVALNQNGIENLEDIYSIDLIEDRVYINI